MIAGWTHKMLKERIRAPFCCAFDETVALGAGMKTWQPRTGSVTVPQVSRVATSPQDLVLASEINQGKRQEQHK